MNEAPTPANSQPSRRIEVKEFDLLGDHLSLMVLYGAVGHCYTSFPRDEELLYPSPAETITERRLNNDSAQLAREFIGERMPESEVHLGKISGELLAQEPKVVGQRWDVINTIPAENSLPLGSIGVRSNGDTIVILNDSLEAGLDAEATMTDALINLLGGVPGSPSWTVEERQKMIERGLKTETARLLETWYAQKMAEFQEALSSVDIDTEIARLESTQEMEEIDGRLLGVLLETILGKHYDAIHSPGIEEPLSVEQQIFLIDLIRRVPVGNDTCQHVNTCGDHTILGSDACRAHTLADYLLSSSAPVKDEYDDGGYALFINEVTDGAGDDIASQLVTFLRAVSEARPEGKEEENTSVEAFMLRDLLKIPRTVLTDTQFNRLVGLMLRANQGEAECVFPTCSNRVLKHTTETARCAPHGLLQLFFGDTRSKEAA